MIVKMLKIKQFQLIKMKKLKKIRFKMPKLIFTIFKHGYLKNYNKKLKMTI